MRKTAAERNDPENDIPEVRSTVKPKLDDRFIISIEGKDFVTYPGLLDLGHQKGLESIEVSPLQLPTSENGFLAICKATVVSKEGEQFTDLGDASKENCSARVSKHLLRMASTRAIARALRTFTNIGMTCLDELDESDFNGNGQPKNRPRNSTPARSPEPASQPVNLPANISSPPMSDSQRRALYAISKRKNIDEGQLESMCNELFRSAFNDLTMRDASSLITRLSSATAS